MSLKKQVKEVKLELIKKEEEMLNLKRNIKTSRLIEVEHELLVYKEELVRLRYLLETNFSQKRLAHHASHPTHQSNMDAASSVNGKIPNTSSYSDVVRAD